MWTLCCSLLAIPQAHQLLYSLPLPLGPTVNVPCNVCYNIVCPNCEPNGALSWRPSPPPVCVEKVSAAPKCTDIQVQCAKLRACKFNCNNIQKQFEVELATACVNDSQSLLSICKLPDDIPDTLEGGCYLSCGPPEKPGEEDSTLRPEEEECHEIERTFCRRPGRGHNCTGRCIQNAKNSCVSQAIIYNYIAGSHTYQY